MDESETEDCLSGGNVHFKSWKIAVITVNQPFFVENIIYIFFCPIENHLDGS